MLEPLLGGVAIGLTLSILIGPAFFTLIQTSIRSGFRSGVALAVGIFASDVVCILLAYVGASRLVNDSTNQMIIGLCGGIVLVIFGAVHFFQKKQIVTEGIAYEQISTSLLVTKGFLINTVNPFAILFWLGVVSGVSTKYEFRTSYIAVFFSGTLLTVLFTDILKAYIALKIKPFLRPDVLLLINRISGIILVGFGMSLIYRVVV